MASRKLHLFIRRPHRYLSIVLGIQFFLWTVGGLYFRWSNIHEIHGDLDRKQPPYLSASNPLISPTVALENNYIKADSFHSIQLVSILEKPYYDIRYFISNHLKTILVDASTGIKKPPIGKDEAIRIAAQSFNKAAAVKSVNFIKTVSEHSEYREKPLPAWKITFDYPGNTNVYVSADLGKVETFRNSKWRIFDFLWMLPTMDYKGRDNINNWVLRVFSIFGLITIASGFALFLVSSRLFRRKKQNSRSISN
jgi:hypothetical protein